MIFNHCKFRTTVKKGTYTKMIKNFANRITYEIPKEIEGDILAVLHGYSEKSIKTTYPVYPITSPLMIYVYGDKPRLWVNGKTKVPAQRLHLAGQIYNADVKIILNGLFGQIGFMLHPASTYYLFHKPGSYFLNRWRPLLQSSPIEPKTLLDSLDCSLPPLANLDLMIAFLQKLSKNRLPAIAWLDASVVEINKQNGNISVQKLSENVGLSSGYFRKKFKQVIGVPPKYFCKVVQLNAIFEAINTGTEKLHQIALDCGYYDQAHFINDFNRFIGQSPENFLKGKHGYVKSYLGKIKE